MALIILDRDGVINEDSDNYIRSLADWLPIPGSIEAIAQLSVAGHQVAVATNQSGLGRGYFDLDDLEAIHSQLCDRVEEHGGVLAGIFYCPHRPEDNCNCRKPRTGLLDAIAAELQLPVSNAFFVGDSMKDLQAAVTAGASWTLQPARGGRDHSPKRRQTSHKYTSQHTGKRERSRSRETRTNKDVKAPRAIVNRMDVLQIMEPNNGMNLWDTRLVEEFLEAHRKADTIEDFVVFTKESTAPRWFQVAIKHSYPRDKIMAEVSLIFQGTITKKTPILNIIGRVSQADWRMYKNDNRKKTGRDSKRPIHIH